MTNYFIFVFKEDEYEDEGQLGKIFKFPISDRGGYKCFDNTRGSWGKIVNDVCIGDKVIITISGNSKREDKKTFWGYADISNIEPEKRKWILNSTEFTTKVKTDSIINQMPDEYKRLYVLNNGHINIGRYGTIKIDQFQYEFIVDKCF